MISEKALGSEDFTRNLRDDTHMTSTLREGWGGEGMGGGGDNEKIRCYWT